MSDAEITELELKKIRLDGGTQSRVMILREVVGEYAERMLAGDVFPPLSVFFDGCDYWLADGFHRFYAYEKLCRPEVVAEIHIGTRRDAILYSLGANATHGLRRTTADKRRSVTVMLADEYWSQWSNREIAKRAGVDEKTVRHYRFSLMHKQAVPRSENATRIFKTRHGKISNIKINNIGKNPRRKKKTSEPRLSESLLRTAGVIVRSRGRNYAEALIASLKHYLELTKENSERSN